MREKLLVVAHALLLCLYRPCEALGAVNVTPRGPPMPPRGSKRVRTMYSSDPEQKTVWRKLIVVPHTARGWPAALSELLGPLVEPRKKLYAGLFALDREIISCRWEYDPAGPSGELLEPNTITGEASHSP